MSLLYRFVSQAFLMSFITVALAAGAPEGSRKAATPGAGTPEGALAELREGNRRFCAGERTRTVSSVRDGDLRATLVQGQAPFAVVVTCADSRLSESLIFDQELGRLFTVRDAGNTLDPKGIASVEYAVANLGARLVVILGHSQCGAVAAVRKANGQMLPGHLWTIQASMAGLLESTPQEPKESDEDHLARLVEQNARRQAVFLLHRSEILRQKAAAGQLQVVPAVYDLGSGRVRFLNP
jgi:carbonic anhydrase